MSLAHYIHVNYPQYRVFPYLAKTLERGPKKMVGFLGLGTLGERNRLDGDARHQYAFEYNRDGGCLV